MMLVRAALQAQSARERLLRKYLPRVGAKWVAARQKMRAWALQWRIEVQTNGRSEISDALLDLAVGWRSVSETANEFACPVGRAQTGAKASGAGGRPKQAPVGVPVLVAQ